ncbi:MAG: porin family protein [Candidatus Aminicenantaceae bacterium]
MKKGIVFSIVIFILFVCGLNNANAEVGIKAGLCIPNITLKGSYAPEGEWKSRYTGYGGGYFNFELSEIFDIQTEIHYSMKGARYLESIEYMGALCKIEFTAKHDYLEVPVLLMLNIAGKKIVPGIYAGPYGAFKIKSMGRTRTTVEDSEGNVLGEYEEEEMIDTIKDYDFGAVFGIEVKFIFENTKLILESRYSLGLINLYIDPEGSNSIKNRAFVFMIGVGY